MNVLTYVEHGEHIDDALKRFRKQCERSGTLFDAKRAASRFVKPGEKRRIKRQRARKRLKKIAAKKLAAS